MKVYLLWNKKYTKIQIQLQKDTNMYEHYHLFYVHILSVAFSTQHRLEYCSWEHARYILRYVKIFPTFSVNKDDLYYVDS